MLVRAAATHDGGSVAILFTGLLLALVFGIGVALDYGRWVHARTQTMAAIDAAVLAGAQTLQVSPGDTDRAVAVAAAYYARQTEDRLGRVVDSVAFNAEANSTAVAATGSAEIETIVLSVLGLDRLSLFSSSGAMPRAALTMGTGTTVNLEVSLIVDLSTPLSASELSGLKSALEDFVDMSVWTDGGGHVPRISIIPFAGDVRVPASLLNQIRGASTPGNIRVSVPCPPLPTSPVPSATTCSRSYALTSCVAERQVNEKYSDAVPGAGQHFTPEYSANGQCHAPTLDEIVLLTSDKSVLKSRIAQLVAAPGAAGHLGLAWGWYVLSPHWGSVWPQAGNAAAPYVSSGQPQKIAILISRGGFSTAYDSNGLKTSLAGAGPPANGSSAEQALALCDGMRQSGLLIYSVKLGASGSPASADVLSSCAYDTDTYYEAADTGQLRQAITDIAVKLSHLHLTQ